VADQADRDPAEGSPDVPPSDEEPLRTDPRTGSTPADPAEERSGPPPEGQDPMGGEAPSG
jgi:hypothetical protein